MNVNHAGAILGNALRAAFSPPKEYTNALRAYQPQQPTATTATCRYCGTTLTGAANCPHCNAPVEQQHLTGPRLSEDRRFWWDGSTGQWRPLDPSMIPPPPAPPQYKTINAMSVGEQVIHACLLLLTIGLWWPFWKTRERALTKVIEVREDAKP